MFHIQAQARWTISDESDQIICKDDELKSVAKKVDYRQFLDLVSKGFGEDKLLDFIDKRSGHVIGAPV